MTPNQFVALMVRLFALWLLLIVSQIVFMTLALHPNLRDGSWGSLMLAAIYVVLAAVLWKFPMSVAGKIVSKAGAATPMSLDAKNAVMVAFVGFGLLVIALKALSPIASYISLLIMVAVSGQSLQLLTPNLHMDGITGIVMLLIGLLSVTKARSCANWILPKN